MARRIPNDSQAFMELDHQGIVNNSWSSRDCNPLLVAQHEESSRSILYGAFPVTFLLGVGIGYVMKGRGRLFPGCNKRKAGGRSRDEMSTSYGTTDFEKECLV